MADHNKQTVHSLKEMASETYEMSLSLDEYASESLCNISYYGMSMSCSSSLLFETSLYRATLESTKKKVLQVWHIETDNCAVLCSVQ
jgi:hypothetical protein